MSGSMIREILHELDQEINELRKIVQHYDDHWKGEGDPPGFSYQDGKITGLILAHSIVKEYEREED